MNYPKYVVYDIREYFKSLPTHPEKCIHCENKLIQKEMEISAHADQHGWGRAIFVHDFTILFTCKNCDWWCIRESWDDADYSNASWDFLVVGAEEKDESGIMAELPETPWESALKNERLYAKSYPMPKVVLSLLKKTDKK